MDEFQKQGVTASIHCTLEGMVMLLTAWCFGPVVGFPAFLYALFLVSMALQLALTTIWDMIQ